MRNNSITFLGYRRENPNQTLLTLEYQIKDNDGNFPPIVSLEVPFQVAHPVAGGNKYPVAETYDPKTGVLTYTFEIPDNDDYNYYRQHQFNSNIVFPNDETIPFDTIVELNGVEETPVVIPTKTVIFEGKLIANLEVRRSNSKVPNVIEKIILSKHIGIDETKEIDVKYSPEFGGDLQITLTLDKDTGNRNPFNIELGVKIPESNNIAYVSLSETDEIKTLVKHQVRSVFLANEILTVNLMIRNKNGRYPSEVKLPESFTRAIGVPAGISKILTCVYTKETGNLKLQVRVQPDFKRDKVFAFGCKAEVDSAKSNLEFYCKVDNTNNYNLKLTGTELTKYGHLKCRFLIKGGDEKEVFNVGSEIPMNVLNIKRAKSKQVTQVDNRTFDITFLSTDINALNFFVEGYLSINNIAVPYSVAKLYKKDTAEYDRNSCIDKETVIFNFKLHGGGLPVIDLEDLRLYENGMLTDKKPTNIAKDQEGGFTVTFPRSKLINRSIEYKLLGYAKIKLDGVRYRTFSNTYHDYFTNLGKCELTVVKHTLSYDKEELVLRPTFINGNSPVNVGLQWGETFLVDENVAPNKLTYEKGLLTISYKTKRTETGRIYSKMSGWIKLPDYGQKEEIPFVSFSSFGSDFHPCKLELGQTDQSISSGRVTNKNGSFPEKLEMEVKHTTGGEPALTYIRETGKFSIDLKYPLVVEETTKHKTLISLIVINGDERESVSVSLEEVINPRPSLSVHLEKVDYDDKELMAKFTYKCLYTNGTIPSNVDVSNIYYVNTSTAMRVSYNPKTGELIYFAKLAYKEGKLDIRHEVIFSDNFGLTTKLNSNTVYAPKTSATVISGVLDKENKLLTVKWIVRDSTGEIPKTCDHSNKEWVDNLGWRRGVVQTTYDGHKGILTAIIPVKVGSGYTNYTGVNKFKLPFPDVNWYPLTFNITR